MRRTLVALMLACGAVASAPAQVSVGIGVNLPGVSIGINVPSYPQLVRVPDYPVYYAPGVNGNFFFYDGLYWVYEGDNWYQSSWYNGPWVVVDPGYVPLYVLRVPVRSRPSTRSTTCRTVAGSASCRSARSFRRCSPTASCGTCASMTATS